MAVAAKVLGWTACTVMTLFGMVGALFVAGYAFTDLDPWVALAATAAWLVPTLLLCALALRRPGTAAPVLVGLAVGVALATVLDAAFSVVDIDAVGPVTAVAVFATAVALGVLGLHREALSGLLLVLLAVAQFSATALSHRGATADGGGPGLSDLLTTSSGVIVVPMAVAGLLYLVAGVLDHEPPGLRHLPRTTRAAH